ncbi:hypothetical protein [Nocardia sp. NPDC004722]
MEIQLREAYTEDTRSYDVDWDAYNGALVALSLVATPAVSAATAQMSDAVQELTVLVDADPSEKDHDGYRQVHGKLSSSQLAFVNAARFALDPAHKPLDWQMGGPPEWERVQGWLVRASQRRSVQE